MTRKSLKTGDILQIPLPNDLGFAYAQGVNLLKDYANQSYPTLIRVFNYRSISPEVSLNKIINKELILSPLLIGGILPVLREGLWKIVDNLSLQDEYSIIPHYKKGPDELNRTQWYFLINADISNKVKSTYENVKHLETIGATGSRLVGTKIAMALLQDEGEKIENHFKLNEYFEKVYYKEVTEIPAYYKQPLYMQGKAITSS